MDPENIGTEAIVRVTHWLRGIWEMKRRASPVQQWVDSIPSYENAKPPFDQGTGSKQTPGNLQPENTAEAHSFLKKKHQRKSDMTASAPITIPNSPAITMTGPLSSVPHNRLVRDLSLQSDSSHCSSVESLLEWRKADPEAILLSLGFGYNNSPQESGSMPRIPKRFLQPSKLKGIVINDFLKQQQEDSESLDTASLGYRGLTGSPYVAPSEIVQKIMERLREHESHENDSYTNTNSSSSELFGSMQQEGRLSVLSPDNRQYLERPRSKSPDMRNKRMIIGEKSFAFGKHGDLIEMKSLDITEETNFDGDTNDFQSKSTDPVDNFDEDIHELGQSLEHITQSVDAVIDIEKSRKMSARKLAKQLSFDEDNLKYGQHIMDTEGEFALHCERLSKDQSDSLATVVSKWSDTNETTTDGNESINQDHHGDQKANPISRRASDSLCEMQKRYLVPPGEERRLSDSTIHSKSEKRRLVDKKPSLKRQANVTDVDPIVCENLGDRIMEYEMHGEESSTLDKYGLKSVNTWDSNSGEGNCDAEHESGTSKDAEKWKVCCSEKADLCCKNDELDQICEHEETSIKCCCHANSTNCWRKMSEIMKKKQKVKDMVAKSKQEMDELREMINSVMSVTMKPGC
ncbi:protein ITPRID2 isoform X1 [Neodiprion pinetum]|uniref:protein ITPRID2 isoform X1 n=2 Tax=Neodiprion pinetum TaxID=441929 RepID=UPI001EDF2140|nr:protein ITPRID2 isoform X1 [Neodiprion pinetum]